MRAVIDTCVVLDALQRREPFFDDAQKIFLLCANREFDGFITAKAITDIYYITHRQTHSDKDTRKILTKLCILFDLLDTAAIDARRAISSEVSDFEDAVMIETAIRSNIDCIVTRNIKDYSKASLPVYSPSQFIEFVLAENSGSDSPDISTLSEKEFNEELQKGYDDILAGRTKEAKKVFDEIHEDYNL